MPHVLLALLFGVFVTGCAALNFQTKGYSGPVSWRAEDLRVVQRTVAGEKRDLYAFTFVLQETQGTGITFTSVDTAVYQPNVETLSSGQTGQWILRPFRELRWPFSFFVYCANFGLCIKPNLTPSYEIVFTGADTRGEPVRVAATLRLPPNPHAVPKTRRMYKTITQQAPDASPVLTVLARVPIQIINNVIFVSALANHKERLMLLLDTGASYTILTPDVADALGLRITSETPRWKIRIFGGQEVNVPFVRLVEMAVGQAVIKEMDIGIYLGHPETPIIDGVLGGDFLNRFTVTINYATSRLQLAHAP